MNHVALDFSNSLMATGGDDCVVRIYALAKDFKKQEKKMELPVAEKAIKSLDFTRDQKFLVAGSEDGTAYIFDLTKKGSVVQKLNFKPAPNQKNMSMRACLFARDNSLFTLCTYPQLPSYLIKWQCVPKEKGPPQWTPAITKEVHNKPCAGMRASRDGKLAVMTSDGWVGIHDAVSLQETTGKRKLHNMPVTSLAFREEEDMIATAGLDYKYFFVPVS